MSACFCSGGTIIHVENFCNIFPVDLFVDCFKFCLKNSYVCLNPKVKSSTLRPELWPWSQCFCSKKKENTGRG